MCLLLLCVFLCVFCNNSEGIKYFATLFGFNGAFSLSKNLSVSFFGTFLFVIYLMILETLRQLAWNMFKNDEKSFLLDSRPTKGPIKLCLSIRQFDILPRNDFFIFWKILSLVLSLVLILLLIFFHPSHISQSSGSRVMGQNAVSQSNSTQHTQSTKNNKFVILCSISRKTLRMNLIFCL